MTNISQRASVEQVEVTAEKNALDIASYISARVDQLQLHDSGFASDIIHNLQHKTQGMFLYARLMIEELEIQDTDNERRDTLSIMPTGVDDIYGRALANIDGLMSNRRQRIHQLLQLVLCTARPFTVSEAQVALAVKANSRQFDEKNIPNVSTLVDQYCRSFIEIDPKDNTLKVAHATAREFLLGPSAGSLIIKLNVAHNYFLSICLTFLSYERQFVDREPPSSPTPDWSPFRAHVSQNPFLEYAAVHWFSHFLEVINFQQLKNHQVLQDNSILMAGFTRESASTLSTFLSSETDIVKWLEVIHPLIGAGQPLAHHAEDLLAEWLEICQGKSMHVSISPEADDFHAKTESSLISPEEKSLTEQISAFISHLGRSNGYGVQRWLRWRNRERHCREPIFIAASFDFHNFVARELDRGVSTEIRSVMDRTPLNLAAWMESHNTMKTLIDRGANVNHSPNVDGITPLLESLSPLTFARAPRDYYAAAHMLLEAGASVDTGLNPLHALIGGWTDTADQYAILEAILAQTKDVNALLEAADSLTAKNCLHLAAAHNEGRLVKHLLQRHSSPSNFVNIAGASGSDGKQPLHEACYFKISKAGPPLVESGAEINGWSVDKWTPLLIAARYKSDILALLLSHGAEVDSQDATGKTALHLTAENNWIDGTERLLKFGCNVDIISNEQETPLDIALRLQNAESIKLLEIAGARRACDCLKIHSWMMANVHVYIH
jgi:ankyrin repeat protein